jgi:hypothetical protein
VGIGPRDLSAGLEQVAKMAAEILAATHLTAKIG